ncbi:hypothetical protein PIB30_019747 [Stylosanthes scabra]|uniref:Uncharacterized protein n=1 Tax=Stylosanthes scabra TaxID=79078 RepID=A0ABU6WBH1_9FABA|nr:hypothetical protein [Stylosanthes scabra]
MPGIDPNSSKPQAVCHPGSKPVTQKLKAYESEKASQQGSKSRTYQRFIDKIQEKAYQSRNHYRKCKASSGRQTAFSRFLATSAIKAALLFKLISRVQSLLNKTLRVQGANKCHRYYDTPAKGFFREKVNKTARNEHHERFQEKAHSKKALSKLPGKRYQHLLKRSVKILSGRS